MSIEDRPHEPFKIVIPARYGSSRLPGKPLLPIAGKAMVLHVCDNARATGADEIVVATDHEEIRACTENHGVITVMTQPHHRNGTERIAEVCQIRGWKDSDIVVNWQADEPLVPPTMIRFLAEKLKSCDSAGTATLACDIHEPHEVSDPNAVKVVLDRFGHALYFSRAALPWDRDRFNPDRIPAGIGSGYLRHIGLYAYRVDFIKRYMRWEATQLEQVEALEQLRILWHGERILVAKVDRAPEAGVDTRSDLIRVEKKMLETIASQR